jgi:hypothetical protein
MTAHSKADIDDDEELNIASSSARLLNEPSKENGQAMDIPFCGCLSVRYYQPFFDVDTEDVVTRIKSASFFCKRPELFLNQIGDKPDAYGPVWIATTLVFVVAVTSHAHLFLSSWMLGETLEYDFQSIVTAASVVFGFTAAVPTVIWFIFKQLLETQYQIRLITALCLYGYSLFVFIPAAVRSQPLYLFVLQLHSCIYVHTHFL